MPCLPDALPQLLERAAELWPQAVALRYKERGQWQTVSFAGLLANARKVSYLLCSLAVQPQDRVGLFMENLDEWPEIYFGIVGSRAVAVPLDPSLKEGEFSYIARDAGFKAVFVSPSTCRLLRECDENLLKDMIVVVVGGAEQELPGPRYRNYTAALAGLPAGVLEISPVAKDDLAALIYSSGTTGLRKAVMLTHGNFLANVRSCLQAIRIGPEDNFLLILPLHHAFAFTASLLVPLASGAQISFVENYKTIAENMAEVKPSGMVVVPLLLEKMYSRISARLAESRRARWLLRLGLSRVVGQILLRRLGGRLRLIVTGGAPCDPDLLRQWQSLGVEVREGYGLTEAAPVLTINPPDRPKVGTVGRALPGVELKIEAPDSQGVGEVLARGANIMRGYYKHPDETALMLAGGWLHTGDLGRFDGDGYLTICGRKKNLIVNREGKNIYPEEVEAQILKCELVREVLVVGYREPGERVGEKVGAIVVPHQDKIAAYLAEKGLVASEALVEKLVQDEVRRVSSAIAEYKRPRRIQIQYEEFEKTATAKIKRYRYAIDTGKLG